ncbi:hypothetical protein J7M02_03555 [Candidatus Aerophobetes bacterium]|nr:hypothetical protein [Candidatus Aerophobetes bacterium]
MMVAIQIVILVIQLFILYLTLVEMRKAREQQVLPFVTFGGGGGTKSGGTVSTTIRIFNQGTGSAIKVRLYLGKQLITSLAVLSSNESRKITVNLSDNEEWRGLKPNEETINLKAVYENVYERVFVSAINLMKMHDGFPKFIQESFSMRQKKTSIPGLTG